ncbi:MAG TPA: carboxylesterase family protein [Roseiarcus sp.]|jgi:para-nitrobenzyl esterase
MPYFIEIEGGVVAAPPADGRGVRGFKGIPYAAPPVGALRWRPPQPVEPWRVLRSAETFGANSLQGVVFDDIDPTLAGVSEDCLYLNVWTPTQRGSAELAPVLFWIHGGGFVVGSGSEPRYDGANLAAKGIVVVTVNHRLNALGFLAHPELTAESGSSGAYGMLDLVAALTWVARNIGAFGGDPAAVTIAGESAGSFAVSALMASPLAKGLFARAIGQSGGFFASPSRPLQSLKEAEEEGLAFAGRVGAKTLAELRAAPAEAILAAAPGLGFRPIVDGHFVPQAPADIFVKGEQADVPLLAGWTKDEGFNFDVTKGENAGRPYEETVRHVFAGAAAAALAHYPARTLETSARALGGDLTIVHPTWAWIEAQKATGRADIFRFRFDHAPPAPQGSFGDAGAFHAGDIPYVFDNLDAFDWTYSQSDRDVATLASNYWVNFVKRGDPNGEGLPHWPSYRNEGMTMLIDAPARAAPDFDRPRHEFLARVVEQQAS